MQLNRLDLLESVRSVQFWFHSINLGDGVVTPGHKSAARLQQELVCLNLPSLQGKSFLDSGARDGFFSFAAERLGAQVTAREHYSWALAQGELAKSKSLPVGTQMEQTPFWRPDSLPGKTGFDLVHRLLNSRVEARVADFLQVDLASLGQFDVVLYSGVMYHMQNPLAALQRVASVTRQVAVIETEALEIPGYGSKPLFEFLDANKLNNDASCWWVPNLAGLKCLCIRAGFSRVEVMIGPPPYLWLRSLRARIRSGSQADWAYRYRAGVHAYK